MKEVIQKLNRSPNPILAVDIPSGVIGDSGIVEGEAVNADLTVYVGLLKIGHLYNQGFEYAGELHAVDFGMSEKYISEIESFGSIVNLEIVVKNLPFRKRTVNKYSVGQVLLIAGSPGMPGAAILAAKAALRSGAGMVRLCHPPDMEYELFGCPPEVVRHSYTVDHMEKIFQELSRTNAILIGSGLGRSNDVPKILKRVYQEATCPLVIDGDALFFFEGGTRPAILTPHKGELKKLLKVSEEISDLELIRLAEEFAKIHKVVIVFKGAPTTVIAPNQPKVIIPYGNKGMASGGMGDALAGIITSLLAQGKELREAAILGATIHALAGDKAKETHSQYAMIASDLIESLPLIFLQSSD
jgi:NAD(P)H-hydrate epimerase